MLAQMNACLILTPYQKLLQVNKRPSVLLRKYSMCINLVAAYIKEQLQGVKNASSLYP